MGTINRLYLQALISKTATFTGAGILVDSTTVVGVNATLVIRVASFDAGQTARIQITQGTISGSFSAGAAVFVQQIQGGETASADLVFRIPWYEVPDTPWGVSGTAARADITSISGGTITYEVWLES